jgi:hypothetical protein
MPVIPIQDDDQPDLRRAIPTGIPPLVPDSAAGAKPIPMAPDDQMQDQARSLRSATAARAIPMSVSPAAGSTEDLENQGLASHEMHPGTPIQTGVASLWTKAQNIHNPILRVLGEIGAGGARALDTVGTIAAPGISAAIPGTTMNQRVATARANAEEGRQAGLAKEEAGTGLEKSQAKEAEARGELAHEQAQVVGNPKEGLTPEETTIHDLMTGENGQPRLNPKTNQPYSYLEAYTAVNQAKQDVKPEKPGNDFEQFYHDYITDNHLPDSAHNRLMAREQFAKAGQAPQRPQQQLGVVNGKIVELKPGMEVPKGTESLSGDLKGSKPTADETRRSDLARNMNENLDELEEIVKRRPDLFGKLAGRWTGLKEAIGTDDQDIARLHTIKEQMGMAMVGAHAMRNAQHVEAAANSILNSFKNGPDAILASTGDARKSLATFQHDAGDQPGSAAKGAASGAGKSIDVTAPNGKSYSFPDQASADKFKQEAGIK